MASFAHPDDESYGPAGTLAKASRDEHIVSLITLTHGESGSLTNSKNFSKLELAKLRGHELRSAVRKLGIQYLQVYNLPDKHLKDIPEQTGIEIIKQEIKRFNPDVIITFHENTISGHSDHLTVTQWTFNAVKSLPNPPALFFFGLDQKQTAMVTFRKLIPIDQSEITHRINVEDFIKEKVAAIRCHKTQTALWRQFKRSKIDFKDFAKWEVFVQKWPKPERTIIKHELF